MRGIALILGKLLAMKKVLNILAVVFVVVVFIVIARYYRNKTMTDTIFTGTDPINNNVSVDIKDSVKTVEAKKVIVADIATSPVDINTKKVVADSIVDFAETLVGTPYKYASTDPTAGFDCSGFITYVFNHFNIKVPRSSIGFTNVGTEVPLQHSHKGDLILFTGTDSTERFVGHMGIVTKNENADLQFIHSSSGKANGVTITPLNSYYKGRFVKVVRVFPSPLED